ncbi:MAG: hypothetical protein GC164_13120 [Phycisphaera sp.]|nr:hypothetical protein [Phycisphaera sp.]
MERWVLVTLGCVLIAGCAGKGRPTRTYPRISDLASPYTPADPVDPDAKKSRSVTLVVTRIDLPWASDLEKAWALTQSIDTAVPAMARWQRNGLRLATVEKSQWKNFSDRFPSVMGLQTQTFRVTPNNPTADQPTPDHTPPHDDSNETNLPGGGKIVLTTSPAFNKTVNIKLVNDDDTVCPTDFRPGRIQWLVSAHWRDGDGVLLTLTPHHHFPQPSILVRTPKEKELDGVQFKKLSLTATLDPSHLLLIALTPPEAPPPPEVQTPEVQTPEVQTPEAQNPGPEPTVDGTTPPDDSPPQEATQPRAPQPDSLGAALLSGSRFGKRIQMLLVIEVQP